MPPKRRKAVDDHPLDVPQPKRRSQRLAPKAKPRTEIPKNPENSDTHSNPDKEKSPSPEKANSKFGSKHTKGPQTKATKSRRDTKQHPKATISNPALEPDPSTDSPKPATSPFEILTLTSPHLKSPIPCHSYPSPTSTNPSSSSPPTLIFTHGAGGTLSALAVTTFCAGFSTSYPILAFQGSMNLVARTRGFEACISHLQDQHDSSLRLVLGGRSMGSRAATMALSTYLTSNPAPKQQPLLLLVSYPLRPAKDQPLRSDILLALPETVRVLFVIGDRDHMCPLNLLEDARTKMKARSWLLVLRGADHGMVGKGIGDAVVRAGRRAAEWVGGMMDGEKGVEWGDGGEKRVEILEDVTG